MTAFLDTNLLVYAQGTDAKSEIARQVILEGGVISVRVLNEFTSVMRRKFNLSWDEIAEALEDVKTALDIVRPIDVETHWAAVDALPAPKDSAEHKTAFVRGFTGLGGAQRNRGAQRWPSWLHWGVAFPSRRRGNRA